MLILTLDSRGVLRVLDEDGREVGTVETREVEVEYHYALGNTYTHSTARITLELQLPLDMIEQLAGSRHRAWQDRNKEIKPKERPKKGKYKPAEVTVPKGRFGLVGAMLKHDKKAKGEEDGGRITRRVTASRVKRGYKKKKGV
jgi:hypothetical protein